jgi:Holliday junction resolvasome RuvABC endonuclease subunit
MPRHIGIDPGTNGGIAWIDDDDVHAEKLRGKTERDIWELIAKLEEDDTTFAMIECARSSPQMGVTSAFTFGRGFGVLRMALIAAGIAFEEVSPSVWQKYLRCLTRGDKNVTKQKAQELFPSLKITHAIADALLIAECARRMRMFP